MSIQDFGQIAVVLRALKALSQTRLLRPYIHGALHPFLTVDMQTLQVSVEPIPQHVVVVPIFFIGITQFKI